MDCIRGAVLGIPVFLRDQINPRRNISKTFQGLHSDYSDAIEVLSLICQMFLFETKYSKISVGLYSDAIEELSPVSARTTGSIQLQ